MSEWDFARTVYGAVSIDHQRIEQAVEEAGLAEDYDEVVQVASEIEDEIQDGVEGGAAVVYDVHSSGGT